MHSQEIDDLAMIPTEPALQEIRIYKDRGITNSGFVFRMYKSDSKWKAELIQWFLDKEPLSKKLTSSKSLEEIFMNFEALDVLNLPNEDAFQYKKEKKNVVWDEDEKGYLIQTSKVAILDGFSYSLMYNSNEKYNEFTYNNPESYLKRLPEINELKSFEQILKSVRKEFNIEF